MGMDLKQPPQGWLDYHSAKCTHHTYDKDCVHLLNISLKHTHTHTRLTALCPGLPRWAGTRKVKPIWILPQQETVSGSGISWAKCKSAPRSRQITTPAPHYSFFFTDWMHFLLPNQQRQSTEGKFLWNKHTHAHTHVLPFWYRLTRVVLDKAPLHRCVCSTVKQTEAYIK